MRKYLAVFAIALTSIFGIVACGDSGETKTVTEKPTPIEPAPAPAEPTTPEAPAPDSNSGDIQVSPEAEARVQELVAQNPQVVQEFCQTAAAAASQDQLDKVYQGFEDGYGTEPVDGVGPQEAFLALVDYCVQQGY